MLVILFGRLMPVEDKFVLYIVPKVIKDIKSLRYGFIKEQNSLANTVDMTVPILVGDYIIGRCQLIKAIKDDKILSKNMKSVFISHWTEYDVECNARILNSIINSYADRLKIILLSRAMNPPLGWDRILDQNFMYLRGFVKVKRLRNARKKNDLART